MNVTCKTCSKEFNKLPSQIKKSNNNFCSRSCAAKYNNTIYKVKENKYCLSCNKILSHRHKIYCDISCQHQKQNTDYITRWKNGEESGITGKSTSKIIKMYLLEKYNNSCAICNWSMINPFTKTLPLELEHIDGDYTNNKEENLIILCPNCHSLTKTYRGANKGKSTRSF